MTLKLRGRDGNMTINEIMENIDLRAIYILGTSNIRVLVVFFIKK